MQLFSSILLFHTLRGILDELEGQSALDPHNPALVQLKFIITQQLASLAESRTSSFVHARIQGVASKVS